MWLKYWEEDTENDVKIVQKLKKAKNESISEMKRSSKKLGKTYGLFKIENEGCDLSTEKRLKKVKKDLRNVFKKVKND